MEPAQPIVPKLGLLHSALLVVWCLRIRQSSELRFRQYLSRRPPTLARYRVIEGEKAVSLDLGVILESGYVAEHPEIMAGMKGLGNLPLHETELLRYWNTIVILPCCDCQK